MWQIRWGHHFKRFSLSSFQVILNRKKNDYLRILISIWEVIWQGECGSWSRLEHRTQKDNFYVLTSYVIWGKSLGLCLSKWVYVVLFKVISLHVHKMPSELNSCSYQLAYGKTGFVIYHFTAVPRTFWWRW